MAIEKFHAGKKSIKDCNNNVHETIISKLVETKANSKYLIGYLDKDIMSLVLIMPKISGYVKTFKFKDG